MYYAAICLIAKDEDPSLVEWAQYHLRIGFEHIYIYDNNSKKPIRETLAEFVDAGLVTVFDFPLTQKQQMTAYTHCLRELGSKTTWMAFIDVDEFIVPKTHHDIRDFLDDYAGYGGLVVHWKIFGSAGHKRRPPQGVIPSYTQCIKKDAHVKSIIRPQAATSLATPHSFRYRDGFYAVNEDYIPVATHQSYHTSQKIQLNHYYYKSFEDFREKMERGLVTQRKNGETERCETEYADFAHQASLAGEYDDAILNLNAQCIQDPANLTHCLMDVMQFSQAIAQKISGGDKAGALHLMKACLRYHNTPSAWAIAAKLFLTAGKKQESHTYIAKLLLDVHSPYRGQGYEYLMEWHTKFGLAEHAAAILAELKAPE